MRVATKKEGPARTGPQVRRPTAAATGWEDARQRTPEVNSG